MRKELEKTDADGAKNQKVFQQLKVNKLHV